MAVIFYVLGLVGVAIGAGWVVYAVITPPAQTSYDPAMMQLGRLLALSPGVGLIAGGLLLLAIGGVLSRLDPDRREHQQARRAVAPWSRAGLRLT